MRTGHSRKNHEHRSDLAGEYRWGDLGQIIAVIIFFIGILLDVFVFHVSETLQQLFPFYLRMLLFIPLVLLAGYYAQQSHKIIFQEKRETLMVIQTGVYAQLRHPMYFGALLLYLSFVVLSASILALIIFIGVIFFYYYLCRYEEQLLLEKLGFEYQKYMKKVPMLFPKIWMK